MIVRGGVYRRRPTGPPVATSVPCHEETIADIGLCKLLGGVVELAIALDLSRAFWRQSRS